MTAPRNSDALIQAFLVEGLEELPDRAFDAVRRDIHRTRQRVVIGPWKEPSTPSITRLAIAAAIVAAVGVAWLNLDPLPGGFGAEPTPSPAVSPATSPRLVTGDNLPLAPGRYWFDYGNVPDSSEWAGTSIHFTVPSAGWTNFENFAVDRNYGGGDAGAGASFVAWYILNRYVDGCSAQTRLSPAPGPGIDELLEALANQPGIDAGPLTNVTVDGYTGKFVELTVAVDITTCSTNFYPWLGKYVQGNNEVLRVYALDVDGRRLTFFARIPERTTPAHRAELESIIDSIDIQP